MQNNVKMLEKSSCQIDATSKTSPSFTNRHMKIFSTKYINKLNSSPSPTRK